MAKKQEKAPEKVVPTIKARLEITGSIAYLSPDTDKKKVKFRGPREQGQRHFKTPVIITGVTEEEYNKRIEGAVTALNGDVPESVKELIGGVQQELAEKGLALNNATILAEKQEKEIKALKSEIEKLKAPVPVKENPVKEEQPKAQG